MLGLAALSIGHRQNGAPTSKHCEFAKLLIPRTEDREHKNSLKSRYLSAALLKNLEQQESNDYSGFAIFSPNEWQGDTDNPPVIRSCEWGCEYARGNTERISVTESCECWQSRPNQRPCHPKVAAPTRDDSSGFVLTCSGTRMSTISTKGGTYVSSDDSIGAVQQSAVGEGG
jgi:hypothetical protein